MRDWDKISRMSLHTFIINRRQSGQSLVAIMQTQLRLSRDDALQCVRERGVRLAGNICTDVDRRVRSGQHAVTEVRALEQIGYFTLVECRLETGRTHQVRIHLGEQGMPLCGERIYDRPLHGQPMPDNSGAKRPMLHAASLAILHPATGRSMAWESPAPDDMYQMLRKLRKAVTKTPVGT